MQKKRREACDFSGNAVFYVTGVKGSFKGTRIAGEVGEKQGSVYERNTAEEFEFYLEVRGAMEGIKLNF